MYITPFKQETDFEYPLSIDSKIEIFEESTEGWQLYIAELCMNGGKDFKNKDIPPIDGSGFAVLQILLSYFEMIAKYECGFDKKGKSEEFFKKGVKSVFPKLSKNNNEDVNILLKILYEDGRCGLYHGGLTESRILLSGDPNYAMGFHTKSKVIIINPHKLPGVLKKHLKNYVTKLKNPKEVKLRKNFEKRFDWHRRDK